MGSEEAQGQLQNQMGTKKRSLVPPKFECLVAKPQAPLFSYGSEMVLPLTVSGLQQFAYFGMVIWLMLAPDYLVTARMT